MGKHDYSEMPLRESATTFIAAANARKPFSAGEPIIAQEFFAQHVVRLIDLLNTQHDETSAACQKLSDLRVCVWAALPRLSANDTPEVRALRTSVEP